MHAGWGRRCLRIAWSACNACRSVQEAGMTCLPPPSFCQWAADLQELVWGTPASVTAVAALTHLTALTLLPSIDSMRGTFSSLSGLTQLRSLGLVTVVNDDYEMGAPLALLPSLTGLTRLESWELLPPMMANVAGLGPATGLRSLSVDMADEGWTWGGRGVAVLPDTAGPQFDPSVRGRPQWDPWGVQVVWG